MKLSVLMPVYNERQTIEAILRRVQDVPLDLEVIVVDNCSNDGTRQLLQSLLDRGEAVLADEPAAARLRVAWQEQNRGKGSSVRRALGLARGEWVIVQDGDLEYDPTDYLKLLARGEMGRGRDAVFGTRLQPGSRARRDQPRGAFYWGRVGLSVVFRLLYGRPMSDVATCYKLLRRPLALSLDLQGDGFDLDFEIAAKLARRGARLSEVPISYAPRSRGEGKKIRALHDGWRAVWTLVRFRFF